MTRRYPAVGDIRLFRKRQHLDDYTLWCDSVYQAKLVLGYPRHEDSTTEVQRLTEGGWRRVSDEEYAAATFEPPRIESVRRLLDDALVEACQIAAHYGVSDRIKPDLFAVREIDDVGAHAMYVDFDHSVTVQVWQDGQVTFGVAALSWVHHTHSSRDAGEEVQS